MPLCFLCRTWLCPPTRPCPFITAALFTLLPPPTSTSSASSPPSQPSASTYTRSGLRLLCVYTLTCVSECHESVLTTTPFSSALKVIEVRQKETPFLLPEDVFVSNPKYVPSAFSSPSSHTKPLLTDVKYSVTAVD